MAHIWTTNNKTPQLSSISTLPFSNGKTSLPNEEHQNEERPRRSLRLLAFASVAFATVSVLGCVITLPIVYSHVQSIQAFMQNEVDFCKARKTKNTLKIINKCIDSFPRHVA